jgi:hypothetical protein
MHSNHHIQMKNYRKPSAQHSNPTQAPEPVQHPCHGRVAPKRHQPGRVGRPGGHGGERTPDPIPNSAVKTPSAYDTAPQGVGKSVAARSSNPASILKASPPNAGWSSPVARQAHNLKVTGSNPVPATKCPDTLNNRPAESAFAAGGATQRSLCLSIRRDVFPVNELCWHAPQSAARERKTEPLEPPPTIILTGDPLSDQVSGHGG